MPKYSDGKEIHVAEWNRLIESIPASYTIWKDGTTYRAESLLSSCVDYDSLDASTVIQDAIDALSGGGGVVFIKEGTYPINTAINGNNAGIELVGAGRNNTIIQINCDYPLKLSAGAIFRNLQFTSPTTYYKSWFRQKTSTALIEDVVVENCLFTGKGGSRIFDLNWNADAAYGRKWVFKNNIFKDLIIKDPTKNPGDDQLAYGLYINAKDVLIEGNLFDNVQTRTGIIVNYNSSNVNIVNNMCRNFNAISSDSQPIFLYENNLKNINVEGNTFFWDTNPSYRVDCSVLVTCIYGTGDLNINIIGNTMTSDVTFDQMWHGIYLHGTIDYVPRKLVIMGNSIYGLYGKGITSGYGCADSIISNNNIKNVGSEGILLDDGGGTLCARNIIANNIIRNPNRRNLDLTTTEGAGLHISGHYNLISGNSITDETPYQRYAIYSPGTYNRIIDNVVSGAVTGLIITGDPNTIIKRNFGYVTESKGSGTGNGAEQTIAHGLAQIPNNVSVVPTVTGATVTSVWADATNIYCTVTNGKTYNWTAETYG